MLKFFWGTVGSGKSLNLLQRYQNLKRIWGKNEVKLVKPAYDTRTGNVFTRFGPKEEVPDVILPAKIADNTMILHFLTPAKFILFDEAQFYSEENINYILENLNNKNLYFYGLRNDYNLKMWPAIQILMNKADKIIYIPSLCEDCGRRGAVYNKQTANLDTDIGFHYKGVCSNCY